MDLSRRHFVMSSALTALLCAQSPSKAQAGSKDKIASYYLDESGGPGIHGPFIIGAIQTFSPVEHYTIIEKIRAKHNYRLNLSYTSTDKHKIPYVQDLLDYFFNESKMNFTAYVFKPELNKKWPTDKRISEIAYHHSYSSLIRKKWKEKNSLSLNLEKRTTTGEDRFLHNFLRQELGKETEIKLLRSKNDDLLQFVDFLTGCVYAEMRQPKNIVKQELLGKLRVKLGVQNLLDASSKYNGRFKIIIPRS